MPSVAPSATSPELAAAVAAIAGQAGGWSAGRIAAELEEVRRAAAAAGIGPAVTVIHALDGALARGETGPLVQGWLAILADAVAGPTTGAARQALTAACAVRLTG